MISEATLKSWYEDNTSRPFPLAESVMEHECPLPFNVLIGLSISVPYSVLEEGQHAILPEYVLHISSVEISTSLVSITVSAGDTPVARSVTTITDIYNNDGSPIGYTLAPLEVFNDSLIGIVGTVYLGPAGMLSNQVGVYTMNEESGLIDLACIHPYPDSFRGLSVNGRLLTGNVTFVEGENVSITLNEAQEVVISYTPPELEGIKNRGELIQAITDYYGQPITSINGVPPNGEGNFSVVPHTNASTDDSCVNITQVDHGIALSNTCAEPCCDKEQYLSVISRSIGELNGRASRLATYLESVAGNLNSLQNELSILKLGMKQQ